MTPLLLVPLAIAAFVALRARRSDTPAPTPTPTPTPPPTSPPMRPLGPMDGPVVEPTRPGGPNRPPPSADGPFIGPGPRSPSEGDATPIVIRPDTTAEQLQQHALYDFNLYITEDCQTIHVGPQWFSETFLPMARFLVLEDPEAYHHPTTLIHELIAAPSLVGDGTPTAPQQCIAAWPRISYSGQTIAGTLSGLLVPQSHTPSDPTGLRDYYRADSERYAQLYPELAGLLGVIADSLWGNPELSPTFDQPWPDDIGIDPDSVFLPGVHPA